MESPDTATSRTYLGRAAVVQPRRHPPAAYGMHSLHSSFAGDLGICRGFRCEATLSCPWSSQPQSSYDRAEWSQRCWDRGKGAKCLPANHPDKAENYRPLELEAWRPGFAVVFVTATRASHQLRAGRAARMSNQPIGPRQVSARTLSLERTSRLTYRRRGRGAHKQ